MLVRGGNYGMWRARVKSRGDSSIPRRRGCWRRPAFVGVWRPVGADGVSEMWGRLAARTRDAEAWVIFFYGTWPAYEWELQHTTHCWSMAPLLLAGWLCPIRYSLVRQRPAPYLAFPDLWLTQKLPVIFSWRNCSGIWRSTAKFGGDRNSGRSDMWDQQGEISRDQ